MTRRAPAVASRAAALAAVLVAVLALATTAFAVDPALRKQAKDADAFRRSDAARTLAKDGSAEAAALLAEMLSDRSPYVRDAAVVACTALTDAAAVEAVAKAASAKDDLTRRNVAAALGRTKSSAALATLGRLARKDPSPAVRADALDALWGFDGNPDALAIARDGAADADPFVRAAAVEAAGRVGADGAVAIVKQALDDPDDGVRCVARMELRFVARADASALLAASAKDPSWRVRAQTVDDADWLRDGPAVDALVALVGDPVLRVSGAAHRVLQLLSGKDLGRDADLWRAWWEPNRAAWRPPHGRLDETKPPAGSATRATYHGIEITSERVAFVLDFSGSMREPVAKDDPRTRADAARAELTQALAALPDGTLANVLLFQAEVRRCSDRATPLTEKTRKEAESMLRATPGERGNLLAAVLEALRDDQVDTVFLLSDGAPSAGDMVDRNRVEAAIRQLDRVRKVAIHTIGFGAGKAMERNFLQGVARDSGGECVFR